MFIWVVLTKCVRGRIIDDFVIKTLVSYILSYILEVNYKMGSSSTPLETL